jgi:sulfoxide reductase heme-binding subunit YedZ
MVPLKRKLRKHWLQILTHAGALTPLALLIIDYVRGRFFIDLAQQVIIRTGWPALILLLLTLTVTPLNLLIQSPRLQRLRRTLGLYTFFYAALHVLAFTGLDYRFNLRFLGPAIIAQPFIVVGALAFLILLVLALTSTRGWQKRLGKRWKQIQRAVYAASLLVIVHVMWQNKSVWESLPYLIITLLLLALRLPPLRRRLKNVQWHFSD